MMPFIKSTDRPGARSRLMRLPQTHRWSMLFAVAFVFAPVRDSFAQSADDGYDPSADNTVQALAVQANGKLIVGGEFTEIGGATRYRLARLNADGNLDAGFAAVGVDGVVFGVATQTNGNIVIAGAFTQVGAYLRNGIARLDADGNVDATFDPKPNLPVTALAPQPDGKLVVGGLFTSLAPNGGGSVARNHVARLNADGSVDMAFNPNADSTVFALALQRDGKIVLAGGFTGLAPNGGGTVTRNHIARVNADGSLDPAFDPSANQSVGALLLQSDGKLLLGGNFTSLAPNGGGSVARNFVARLNSDGTVDMPFDPKANTYVYALAMQSDGKVVLGGQFTSLAPNGGGSVTRNHIARVNMDGSLDTAFDPNADDPVTALALQPDGKLVLGGVFASLTPNGGASVTRNHVARINIDGSVDTTLDSSADGSVRALASQSNGRLVIGGAFTSVFSYAMGSITRNRIARLKGDGSVDTDFDPNVGNGGVVAVALQSDGKLVLGGDFDSLAPGGGPGVTRHNIARVNGDGSMDSAYDPNADDTVYGLALQPDGKLVLGGVFTSLSPNEGGSVTRNHVARLDANGSLDSTFDPDADSGVLAFALQPDGKVVLGGDFTTLAPNAGETVTRNNIARLNADGSLDMAFDPAANSSIGAIALQPDGKLLIGGTFTTLAPNGGETIPRQYIARLNADGSVDPTFDPHANDWVLTLALQLDGKVVLGGYFTRLSPNGGAEVVRSYVARLNADGSVDMAFDPDADYPVYALALQSDGKVVLGGDFTSLHQGNVMRLRIARLGTPDAALQSLDAVGYTTGGSVVTWRRSGAGPEAALPPRLSFSLSGEFYAEVGSGAMERVNGGWRYRGFVPPLNQNFFLRTTAQVRSGTSTTSDGLVESTRLFYLNGNDGIFIDLFE